MNALNLLFAAIFVVAAAYDAAMIYSVIVNRWQHRKLNSLTGLLGKVVNLEGLVPMNRVKNELYIGWLCDLLLIIWNAADLYQISQEFFLIYSIVGILIGGIYFHHHFVRNRNYPVHWYARRVSWSSVTKQWLTARRCYRWVAMDNLYSLIVINVPLVFISVVP